VRIAVVNDYALVVAGVAALLDRFPDRVEVVELDSGMAVHSKVDIALYDTFGQAQGDALDVATVVGDSGARVVIYSWNLQSALVEASLRAGAAGYVSKGSSGEELVSLLERVRAGETVVPGRVGITSPTAAGRADAEWPGKAEGLSAREAEIIALITQGLPNKTIASRSYLSINSVKTYIRSAYRKMGVTSRSQAVLWGVRHGFEPDVVRKVEADTHR
jgi:DNA-binding NarL/FixJ family response regulator